MIVISGAGGRLGSAVLAELLERVAPGEIGVSTTRPDELGELAARGVRVRLGSFDDGDSLRYSFEGADRVLVVSAPRIGASALDAHRTAIDAAIAAGVGRLFYTSHVGADALSPFPPAVTHAATEVLLRDSGLAFTALRNGFYADTPLRLARAASASGELRVPADAAVSWTFHRDLAPAIATLLLDESVSDPVLNLTSSRAVDMAELAAIASSVSGGSIRHRVLSDEEYGAELLAAGTPEFAVRMTLGIFQAARQRRLGISDPLLETLIGRASTSLADELGTPAPLEL